MARKKEVAAVGTGKGRAAKPVAPALPRGASVAWDRLPEWLERQGARGIFAFCGPETLLKREALDAMKRALAGGADAAAARYAVDTYRMGEQETGEILSAASQAGLFGGDRLIWVEGLERFTRIAQRERDAWFACLAATPPNPVILVTEQTSRELMRRSKALSELLGAVTVVDFWRLYPDRAARWLMERSARMGLKITPAAAATMLRHLGTDLQALASEIEKIALLQTSGRIDASDLHELSRRGVLSSSWACIDHVFDGELHAALESFASVRREEASFSFAWKLNQSATQRLIEGAAGGGARPFGGWQAQRDRAHATRPLDAAQKNLLGRLLWGCYEWERDLKTGRWAGAHDYTALEALVIAHMNRTRALGRRP